MKAIPATKIYTLAFGLFLGLCIWKFGNPVILDHKINPPLSFNDYLNYAWPLHWANWILLPLVMTGAVLIFQNKIIWPSSRWLWQLPLIWLGWQFLAATQTVDTGLTAVTLWQFFGCVACYFLGALLFNSRGRQNLLFIGLFIAFTFCLVRAVDQRLFEFPVNHQLLIDGEHCGWTNFVPETVAEMKRDNIIITTNGVDMANPVILAKFEKGRVLGTLVYPNALAGLILLLFPASFFLVYQWTKPLKIGIRIAGLALAAFLGVAAFFWSGSKLGWLIGLGVAGVSLLRLNWSKKFKMMAVATVVVFGLGVFVVRFHHYFATGAHSANARLDYWRAAAQTTLAKPLFGTGPGTFQRAYAEIKIPESEMARLTHNDYLEQFSDSGVIGGLIYATWIVFALMVSGRKTWFGDDAFTLAIFLGLMAWFVHGVGEFSLYIPALAWTTFTLLGCLIGFERIEFDKKSKI